MPHIDNRSDEQLLAIIWEYLTITQPLTHSDIILVGGCDDMATIEFAIDLHQTGFAPLLFFSGKVRDGTPESGADAAAKRARSRGVSEDAIIRDSKAKNAGQTIKSASAVLHQRYPTLSNVILVHRPFMARSFLATAEAQWVQPCPTFAVQHTNAGLVDTTLRYGRGAIFRAVLGEFQRLHSYGKKGYQTVQDIPEAAQIAYDTLLWRGHKTR